MNKMYRSHNAGKTVIKSTDSESVIEKKFDEAMSKEKTQIDLFHHFRGYLPKIP